MTDSLSRTWSKRLASLRPGPATVLLPEGDDPRVRRAATQLLEHGVRPLLIGPWRADLPRALECRSVYECETSEVADRLDAIAARKKWTGDRRRAASTDPLLLAAASVGVGEADAAVAGAIHASGDVIRAALTGIGLTAGNSLLSSCFLMRLPTGRLVAFGDCAVVPEPDVAGLTEIAIGTAGTFRALAAEEPAVAMLSFSTSGSADHASVRTVRDATTAIRGREPDLRVDGELQFDAAFAPAVGASKAPGSRVAGHANVFVFPNLAAGNIGYKIAERIGGAAAYGPILQGLRAPMNDLSRGCSAEDVVNVALISALQASVQAQVAAVS
ncbi:phosphotransacetylase [Flexivirga sp. ID2601S]|uniref:Phosphotransacetylase n=1 Tax=Flexivirga aerilata TaxID=1656889 RepID=A0A849AH65_9MICO|nr:phosphotransacetylase [Flexivirga aerilata]NNG38621.1 phosphotransacetylase [Flexivirga aerilata]